MRKEDLKIVFFGTPQFAVASLQRLVDGGYNVVGVVTMPDKPAGRGHKLYQSDVKQYAIAQHLPLLQPVNLKDEAFVASLRALQADLQVVIAFRMLPEVVWSMPRLGTFNLHASLLPRYRGAAPINWAIIHGDTQTGVTTFFLNHEIDTGDIIQQRAIPIGRHDNAQTIHDRLMMLGADVVIETVGAIANGTAHAITQDQLLTAGAEPTPAPKIFRDTCRIVWNRPAEAVYNFIRGLSPYPAACTTLLDSQHGQLELKIFDTSEPIPWASSQPVPSPGTLNTDGQQLRVACADGWLQVLSLQQAGKRRMPTADFLRGCVLQPTTQMQ